MSGVKGVENIFSFSHSVFLRFMKHLVTGSTINMSSANAFNFEKSLKFCHFVKG